MATKKNMLLWALLGGGALAVFLGRKQIAKGAGLVYDEARYLIFKAVISANAREYAPVIWKIAEEQGVSPFVLAAIGERESRWGAALKPTGSIGTGDFAARKGSWIGSPGTKTVDVLPQGWTGAAPGPWAIPADEGGYGRGLMQLDLRNALDTDWQNPEANVRAGAKILKQKLAYLKSKLPAAAQDDLLRYAVIAYNRGEAAVVKSVQAGQDPDVRQSDGRNYGSDVMSKAVALTQAFVSGGGTTGTA